jgi:hypothetical protein
MNLLVERDSMGMTLAEYTHGYTPVDGIGSIVERKLTVPGQWPPVTYYRYDVTNGRGDVFGSVDENGNRVRTYEYDAWGVRLQAQEVGPASRFGYQANWLTLKDSNGTLCLSPTRLYHAPTGRFLQRDALGVQFGSSHAFSARSLRSDFRMGAPVAARAPSSIRRNLYLFAKGCPPAYVDPSGNEEVPQIVTEKKKPGERCPPGGYKDHFVERSRLGGDYRRDFPKRYTGAWTLNWARSTCHPILPICTCCFERWYYDVELTGRVSHYADIYEVEIRSLVRESPCECVYVVDTSKELRNKSYDVPDPGCIAKPVGEGTEQRCEGQWGGCAAGFEEINKPPEDELSEPYIEVRPPRPSGEIVLPPKYIGK